MIEKCSAIYSGDEVHQAAVAFNEHLGIPMLSQTKFEERISNYTQIENVLATSSGTAALHLALLALGVGAEDEVICPTFTFVAVANAILYCKATPIFVDCKKGSLNMSPEYLEIAIQDRLKKGKKLPKAVIVVHSYGIPARLDLISEVCEKYNIYLVEDAAGAMGSFYKNRHVGSFGQVGISSFNLNKIITSSGGGVMFSTSKNIIERAQYFANQAKLDSSQYIHGDVGYNYVMHPLAAELGSVVLPKIDNYLDQKLDCYNNYRKCLQGGDIKFYNFSESGTCNHWMIPVTLDRDKTEISDLKSSELFKPFWYPLHMQKFFNGCSYYGESEALHAYNFGFCLPSTIGEPEETLELAISCLKG